MRTSQSGSLKSKISIIGCRFDTEERLEPDFDPQHCSGEWSLQLDDPYQASVAMYMCNEARLTTSKISDVRIDGEAFTVPTQEKAVAKRALRDEVPLPFLLL